MSYVSGGNAAPSPKDTRAQGIQDRTAATAKQAPRIILIDDDHVFGHIMRAAAKQRSLNLDHFESLAELGFIGMFTQYDAVIIDYHLGEENGIEIAGYLRALLGHIPLVLISAADHIETPSDDHPGNVKAYVNKKRGYSAILDAALDLVEKAKSQVRP